MSKIFSRSIFIGMVIFGIESFAQTNNSFLTIEGEVTRQLKLSVDDLLAMDQTKLTVKNRDSEEHIYKGVKLLNLLERAGVTLGNELRGENLTKYILIKASDGYEVIFSLPEVDPVFTDQIILLALQVDGKFLPPGEGPFRIIAPSDKRPARWIREVSAIKIVFSKE